MTGNEPHKVRESPLSLAEPLMRLATALSCLDEGSVDPMLAPAAEARRLTDEDGGDRQGRKAPLAANPNAVHFCWVGS
jgi:hypothetical protein